MSARPPREDPFGQRFLKDEETVFDYNAWDGVDFPEEKLKELEETLQKQKEHALDTDSASELRISAQNKWDDFYGTHQTMFFKDRKWLTREFPELFKPVEEGVRIFSYIFNVLDGLFGKIMID